MHNPKPIGNLIQCLTQPHSVVCGVHLCKAQEGILLRPKSDGALFDPVASDSEVCICI
jgi:hypothetical protein